MYSDFWHCLLQGSSRKVIPQQSSEFWVQFRPGLPIWNKSTPFPADSIKWETTLREQMFPLEEPGSFWSRLGNAATSALPQGRESSSHLFVLSTSRPSKNQDFKAEVHQLLVVGWSSPTLCSSNPSLFFFFFNYLQP